MNRLACLLLLRRLLLTLLLIHRLIHHCKSLRNSYRLVGHTHKWMSEIAIWGHGSLLARITPAGDHLFYFQYTNEAGKRYALPIGTYGPGDDAATMTLSDAQQRAMELASLHKTGIKNIREHLESEEAARIAARDAKVAQLNAEKATATTEPARQAARKSVTELFEHWAKVDLINRKDGGAEVRRMFEKDVLLLAPRPNWPSGDADKNLDWLCREAQAFTILNETERAEGNLYTFFVVPANV
ncbi:DUF4102 domain-containing protein [Pseudomonas sp. Y39-6]|uniref:Arm DNA-binding domain-containing protein n=1 Tax=Pseudomonas sp. Y39-6 TaxID=2749807 RepID=UPI0019104BD6|nr:Arm DNA-binding domain-containing protein [Pseudomonas sp. Y39-6]QPO21736.1 DUF4102 domain-containing protein [Pseudomonas sp. Y39-6]URS58993.1 DUF4102 domain-containing protein [Pseudomonas sp. Y39-6]